MNELDSLRGFTWLDWIIALVIAVFAVRGLFRGTVRQAFGCAGVLIGLWAAGWMAQWVGAHWQHARPAVVFWVLKWLVAGLAGLAVASLLEWCGERAAGAVKASPLGWLDRLGGLTVGALFGAAVVALALVALVLLPWPRRPRAWTESSRSAPTLLVGGAVASGWAAAVLPRGRWLHERFLEAERRVTRRARAS